MIENVLSFALKTQDTELLYLLIDHTDILSKAENAVLDKVLLFLRKFDRLPSEDELGLLGNDWKKLYIRDFDGKKDALVFWFSQEATKIRVLRKIREAAIAVETNEDAGDLLLAAARLADGTAESKELSLRTDWEHVLELGLLRKYDDNSITTGVAMLDAAIGGLFKEDVSVVMAPSSRGKSMYLAHTAYCAMREGKNVLAVTLEITEDRWGQRILQRIGMSSQVEVLASDNQIFIKRFMHNTDGECMIRYYPAKSLSVAGLESMVDRCITTGFYPDLVLVDYIDEMRPGVFDESDRGGQRGITQGLGNLAKRFNIHVMSATQTNREGLNKQVITEKEIGQNYGKYQVADVCLALCQTDIEFEARQGRIYVAKSRNEGGRGIQVPIRLDFSTAMFEDIDVFRPGVSTFVSDAEVERAIEETSNELFSMRGRRQ